MRSRSAPEFLGIPQKPIEQDFVQQDSKLRRSYAWAVRVILPFRNGVDPPAAVFDHIEKKTWLHRSRGGMP
jgi:hypothetical protein